jgi:Ca2+-binding RTX toxin-like protein
MGRVPMLLAAMAVMVTLFATVAYAAEVLGTDQSDVLYESQRGDSIRGLDGNDTIEADRYPYEKDVLRGGPGRDTLDARDGDSRDIIDGGKGRDLCEGDPLDTYVDCEPQFLD